MVCDESHCADWPPACDEGYYRPTEGEVDEFNLVPCALCDHADCDDFVVPECDPGDYRPYDAENNS